LYRKYIREGISKAGFLLDIDIHGWVEVNDPWTGEWSGAIQIDNIIGRSYQMFSRLFGVPQAGNDGPPLLVVNHSLPMDVSNEVQGLYSGDSLFPLWINYVQMEGLTVFEPLQGSDPDLAANLCAETEISPGWSMLFQLMHVLASRYGEIHVRLVVWFSDAAADKQHKHHHSYIRRKKSVQANR
jgi:hypothetical protein